MKIKPAFVTGSRIYSNPRPDSDIDLVLILSESDIDMLRKMSDDGVSLRFGNLNIIPVPNKKSYTAWKRATEFCKQQGKVSREFAVGCIKSFCKFYNSSVFTGSGKY